MTKVNQKALNSIMKSCLGNDVSVYSYNKLSERSSVVARIGLINNSPQSIILKHSRQLSLKQSNEENTELREEQLAYGFLSTLESKKKFKPNLIDYEFAEVLILEDLGDKDPYLEKKSFQYLIPRLAESIAHLHGCAYGHFDSYLKLRNELGLGSDRDDKRRYGKPAYERLYSKGVEFILSRYEISFLRNNQNIVTEELEQIFQSIKKPNSFLSFIHDDLGNARQTYELNNQLLILDFEYSKYSHILLEFVKLIVGKFETDLSNGNYIWTQTNFPLELIDCYRKNLEKLYHISFSDDEWKSELYKALSYGSIALIGRLCLLEANKKLVGSVLQNIKGIFNRLLHLTNELKIEKTPVKLFILSFLKEF